MRRVRIQHLLWGTITVAVFLTFGCSTTAYKQYLGARADYDQCVKQEGSSRTQCVAEREKLQGAVGAYEKEAEDNQWWRNAIEDVRDKEPLSAFDRK
ncbi:hypothetical protein [Candidatus Entotheonella palauensis]|uniref:Lipoprotein n=1 Tax=Candidatus Entotheonella gemina TaxID=1429439 RepID=W4M1Y0_9BACT|nr:hypothetical protein [Candidatus Entotheonella palauensis]ETX03956.1 MAG: hypothetical protein ETSY2_31565 [Candidatus Entotheonella gemina]